MVPRLGAVALTCRAGWLSAVRAWEAHVSRLSQKLANELGNKEKVVVVYKDQVSRLPNLGDTLGEELVGLLVGDPRGVWRRGRSRRVKPQKVVEEGP